MKAQKSTCLFLKHNHPSKSEARYCDWLSGRARNGEILSFKVYPSVPLIFNGKPWRSWKVDFQVFEKDGTTSFHECKGFNLSDDSFRLKRDAFLICYPTIKLYVNKQLYTGKPDRPRLKRWTMAEVVRRNKRAAESRKRMAYARAKAAA